MRVGGTVVINGAQATVVKVRSSAPVAVVEFEDGNTSLHWYGEEPSVPSGESHAEPCACS